MWGYKCYLCKCETNDYFCEDCLFIQKIISLYGVKTVKNTVEQVFLRDENPIQKRIDLLKDKVVTRSQTQAKQTKSAKEEAK
jgi:hypothetical protein